MKKFFSNNKINFLFLFISYLCLVAVVGFDNISFQNTKWLHDGSDSTLPQMGWYFFKNDIWRFPLGSNPNYGLELGSSIVFADSIPILSLFFKIFRSFIPENFQYISLWYFICFFLQLYFSYKILKKFTDSSIYSLIGSLFFIITPILIWQLQNVPALVGQWILLFALYLGFSTNTNKSIFPWIFIIILSSLINFYFMVTILVTYSFLRIFKMKFIKKDIFLLTKDFFIVAPLLLATLYIVGYFEVRMVDTMAVGFGIHKLNLLGIFDSYNSVDGVSWSWLLPDIRTSYGEEGHGFNYFGLGQIIIVLLSFFLLLTKRNKTNLVPIKSNKEIRIFIYISLFLTLWALSNKISLGTYTLLEIPLNKYIFGVLSVVRPTGRLFWIVNYFLLAMSIIVIYKCFDQKKSILIVVFLLVIQIADTSTGTIHRINFFKPITASSSLKDKLWKNLFGKYKIVKTTYPRNYSTLFPQFSYLIEKNKIEKTNIVKLARINRKSAAEAKYYLYENYRNKNLSPNTIYLIDNLGHLRQLKTIFEDDVSFFHRDNIWAMTKNDKSLMNNEDKKALNKIRAKLLKVNEKEILNFEDKDNFYGFGWSHNFKKIGIWSEGYMSTLFFRTEKKYEDLILEIVCEPYITKKNNILEFDIFINGMTNKNVKLSDRKDTKLEILIKKDTIINNEVKIDFEFKNPISPFEVLESPDSRKLGILVKSIMIKSI